MTPPNGESKDSTAAVKSRASAREAYELLELQQSLNGVGGTYGVPSESPPSVLTHFRGIFKRKLMVLAVTLLGIAAAAVYIYRTPPYYLSRATVEVENLAPMWSKLGDLYPFYVQYDLFYQTQIRALKSRDVAVDFLRRMNMLPSQKPSKEESGVATSTEHAAKSGSTSSGSPTGGRKGALSPEAKQEALINAVLAQVTVVPIRNTQLIEVTMGANDQIQARRKLRLYLDAYLDYAHGKKSEMSDRTRSWLKRELAQTEKQLKDSEAELLAFTQKHGLILVERGPHQAVSRFEKAGKALVESKTDRVNLELMARSKATRPLPSEVNEEYVKRVKSQLAKLRADYDNKKAIYSPDFFTMASMRAKIKTLEKALEEVAQKRLGEDLEAAKKRETISQQAFEQAKKDAINTNSLAVQYEILKKSVESNSKLYLMMLQRSKQAELDHGIMGNNIVVSSAPTLPLAPVYPRKDRILLLGTILGLLGGVALAVFLEYMDDTVQTTQDLRQGLNLPILGTVPKLSRNGRRSKIQPTEGPYEFMAHQSPASPFTDAVRIVQNTVSTLLSGKSRPVLCVTSALPREGKTLLSILLGTVIASEDKKVLLVDCDLRKPRIHQLFELDAGLGLSDLVTGSPSEINEAIEACHIPGLFVLTAGSTRDNPVPLLKNPRFREIMHACKNAYDQIILDAPPILGVADARVLSSYADATILVSRAGHTPVEVLRQAKDALLQIDSRILGIVLNMVTRGDDGYSYYGRRHYYGKGYGYYGGYYSRPENGS